MTAKQIVFILIPINILLFYFIYNSINSQVEFEKFAKVRIAENIKKLKDLRQVQIAYKKVNHTYANNFEILIDFLENGDMPIVRAIGERPDSLTELEALEAGLISRETSYMDVRSYVFNEIHKDIIRKENEARQLILTLKDDHAIKAAKEKSHKLTQELNNKKKEFMLYLKQIRFIPHTENKSYNIDAGQVEKGKVLVQVFEISTTYSSVFSGLDAKNNNYDLNSLLKVGSMDEASLNGNWGE